jgi:hypothetical protein
MMKVQVIGKLKEVQMDQVMGMVIAEKMKNH